MTEPNTERPRMSAHLWLLNLIGWVTVAVLAGATVWAWFDGSTADFVGGLVVTVVGTIVLLESKWHPPLERWYIKVRGL